MIGDVACTDLFSAVLKQVLGQFSRFAVSERELIFGSDSLPGQDRLLQCTAGWGSKTFHDICYLERAGTTDALRLQAGRLVHRPSLVPTHYAHNQAISGEFHHCDDIP